LPDFFVAITVIVVTVLRQENSVAPAPQSFVVAHPVRSPPLRRGKKGPAPAPDLLGSHPLHRHPGVATRGAPPRRRHSHGPIPGIAEEGLLNSLFDAPEIDLPSARRRLPASADKFFRRFPAGGQ
jgi:hypothetical protein